MQQKNKMLCIVGPTASGKTHIAVQVASKISGEIISADSRQVYRKMNIGTGKDMDEYIIDGKTVPHHLINIVEPGYHYNVFEYQQDFLKAYQQIINNNRTPVLCGGSGMYIEAVLKNYNLLHVPINEPLREELNTLEIPALINLLASYTNLHNVSDTQDKDRLIRAIEIQHFYRQANLEQKQKNIENYDLFYIHFERSVLRERITKRLHTRLSEGLIEEVEELIKGGLSPEKIMYYGLEYKYVTLFLTHEISYDQMSNQLNTAIHQFAKRQETWFRRMQRNGFVFNYIDGNLSDEEKIQQIIEN